MRSFSYHTSSDACPFTRIRLEPFAYRDPNSSSRHRLLATPCPPSLTTTASRDHTTRIRPRRRPNTPSRTSHAITPKQRSKNRLHRPSRLTPGFDEHRPTPYRTEIALLWGYVSQRTGHRNAHGQSARSCLGLRTPIRPVSDPSTNSTASPTVGSAPTLPVSISFDTRFLQFRQLFGPWVDAVPCTDCKTCSIIKIFQVFLKLFPKNGGSKCGMSKSPTNGDGSVIGRHERAARSVGMQSRDKLAHSDTLTDALGIASWAVGP